MGSDHIGDAIIGINLNVYIRVGFHEFGKPFRQPISGQFNGQCDRNLARQPAVQDYPNASI